MLRAIGPERWIGPKAFAPGLVGQVGEWGAGPASPTRNERSGSEDEGIVMSSLAQVGLIARTLHLECLS